MAKIHMISQARHNYGGRALVSGSKFEADNEKDAEELKLIGFATPDTSYGTRDLVAREPGAPSASAAADGESPARAKRRYNRRDLNAAK